MTKSERAAQWKAEHWDIARLHNIYNSTRIRALKKGIEFTITGKWFRDKALNGVCEATGLPFNHDKPKERNKKNPYSPSLDRFDPKQGYTPENTKVVLWIHNRAKSDDDIYTLYTYCKAMVKAIEG